MISKPHGVAMYEFDNCTAALFDYDLSIAEKRAVRLLDVAGKLGVAKPSVHRMAVQLVRLELLEEGRFSVAAVTARAWRWLRRTSMAAYCSLLFYRVSCSFPLPMRRRVR